MIMKLLYRYNTLQSIFKNKVVTHEMTQIEKFCSFFDSALEDIKGKNYNNLNDHVTQFQSYDLDQNNCLTLDWLYKNVQNHQTIMNQFNNLLAAQIIVLNKGVINNLISREFAANYGSNIYNYYYMLEPNVYFLGQILMHFHALQNKFGTLTPEEVKVLVIACDSFKSEIAKLWPQYISTYFFYISQLSISKWSLKLFFEIYILCTIRISEVLDQFTELQLKSIYYSIGRHGFYNEKLKDHLLQKMSENPKIISDLNFQTQMNLFLCASNLLYKPEYHDLFEQKAIQILKVRDDFLEKNEKIYTIFFLQVFRCNIFNEQIWDFFFSIYKKISQTPQLLYLFHSLIEFSSLFSPKQQKFIAQNLAPNKQTYMQSIHDQRKKQYNPMEKNLSTQLLAIGIEFEESKIINGYEVDFYFPKYNLIMEICGPIHFSFNIDAQIGEPIILEVKDKKTKFFLEQNYNVVTQYKKKYLESLNYNVLYVNFFTLRETNIQTLLLNHIKELK